MSKELEPLPLPARTIPVPQSISPEAQDVLSRAAAVPFIWPEYPSLDDQDGWRKYAELANANMRVMIEALPDPGDDLDYDHFNVGTASGFRISGSDNVLLHVHGGALIGGGGDLCRVMAGRLAAATGATAYTADYRLPPSHPYPAALDDCVEVYRHVLTQHDAERIVVHGSSAGGNLAAALILRAKNEGVPLPVGLILETPELDLTESGDSFQTNRLVDVVLQNSLMPANLLYAGSHPLDGPYLSPLFGDFSGGWPRTLLTAGTRDMFLSNAVRMFHRLKDAGASAELLIYEAMPHGGFFGTPEDQRVKSDVAAFAKRAWAPRPCER